MNESDESRKERDSRTTSEAEANKIEGKLSVLELIMCCPEDRMDYMNDISQYLHKMASGG